MVTPDAEKTMSSNLGIGTELQPDDIDADAIATAQVLYLEGYLYGDRPTDAAVERAVSVARQAGTQVALSLSDPAWVELHGRELENLLDRVDLLFANEPEALGLTGAGSADAALAALSSRCPTVVLTRGAEGSLVARDGSVDAVPAAPVARVVDTTGAGDSFAAGFLYGVLRGLDAGTSARLGAMAAGEVVSHLGARPEESLAARARGAGLIA
jgi:sugar/nucleoside kinase (ribokinase family)